MVSISDFADWRNMPITQELLKAIAAQIEHFVAMIVNDDKLDYDKIQYQKGMVAAFAQVAGWTPELIANDGDAKEADALQ
jgi:hypothetical protein